MHLSTVRWPRLGAGGCVLEVGCWRLCAGGWVLEVGCRGWVHLSTVRWPRLGAGGCVLEVRRGTSEDLRNRVPTPTLRQPPCDNLQHTTSCTQPGAPEHRQVLEVGCWRLCAGGWVLDLRGHEKNEANRNLPTPSSTQPPAHNLQHTTSST